MKGEADPAGRFARTRRKDNRSELKLSTSQLVAASRTPIVVTTEVSPIIEVTISSTPIILSIMYGWVYPACCGNVMGLTSESAAGFEHGGLHTQRDLCCSGHRADLSGIPIVYHDS